jgi:TP901-1 family phage major tail protein
LQIANNFSIFEYKLEIKAMAIFNGTLTVLKMDGTQMAELTNVTCSLSQETFDVTSKESAGWTEILPGVRSATFSAEGIADFQATNKDLADVFAAFTGRTVVAIEWTNGVTGDKKLTCNTYITSCEVSSPMEDTVTYSIEFQSTGAVTSATI